MNRTPPKIESLLEQLGSFDVPEDTKHRYELRRELLCSKFFGDHCRHQSRWNRLVTFTVPLVTGGLMVIVFSVVGVSLNQHTELAAKLGTAPAQIETESQTDTIDSKFIDDREPAFAYDVIQFAPVETANYVLLR